MSEFTMPAPDPALRRLDFLVGSWDLSGKLDGGPGGTLRGTESFAWLDGGFFLVRRWESRFETAGRRTADAGYEFYDADPATGGYRTLFFGSLGPYSEVGSRYTGDFDGPALVLTGPARLTRTPDGGATVRYDGDLPDGAGGWRPWMRATLTRTG